MLGCIYGYRFFNCGIFKEWIGGFRGRRGVRREGYFFIEKKKKLDGFIIFSCEFFIINWLFFFD